MINKKSITSRADKRGVIPFAKLTSHELKTFDAAFSAPNALEHRRLAISPHADEMTYCKDLAKVALGNFALLRKENQWSPEASVTVRGTNSEVFNAADAESRLRYKKPLTVPKLPRYIMALNDLIWRAIETNDTSILRWLLEYMGNYPNGDYPEISGREFAGPRVSSLAGRIAQCFCRLTGISELELLSNTRLAIDGLPTYDALFAATANFYPNLTTQEFSRFTRTLGLKVPGSISRKGTK